MNTITVSSPQDTTTRKYKEVRQTKTSPIIHASANKVWEIVGPGFADAHVWSSALDHTSGSGTPQFEGAVCSERHCDINAKGFNKISETLTEYDSDQRTLAYDAHTGLPGFVTYANNRWRILEVGPGQSKLEMTITMHMKPLMGTLMGGMFRKNLDNTIDSVISDLKVYAETGQISEAKQARLLKLGK